MNARTSVRYMKWVAEKMKAGGTLTDKEVEMLEEAEEASLSIIFSRHSTLLNIDNRIQSVL